MGSEDMIVLSTKHLALQKGLGTSQIEEKIIDNSHDIKLFKMSPDNNYIVWAKPASVEIMDMRDWSVRHSFEAPRVQCLQFSQNGSFLSLWNSPENFSRDSMCENFKIFQIVQNEGKIIPVEKHSSQITNYNNAILFWTNLDSCYQIVNKSIKFFQEGKLIFQKETPNLVSASFSPRFACVFCEPADTNYPGMIKLYKLPDVSDTSFSSYTLRDKKDFAYFWNHKGDRVVVTCLDKTDGSLSYYGNNHVYFLGPKGEGFKMDFGDKETAYDITWFPKSDKLAIIHGGFPTTVTLYNNVGDPITKITTGKFNRVIINPFENLMCISGIGSIKGHTEFWSIEKKKPICLVETPISNDIAWMADGVHVVFISTAPKIVVENGYRLMNYQGKTVRESIRFSDPGCMAEDVIQVQTILESDASFESPKIEVPSEPYDFLEKKPPPYVPPSSKGNFFNKPGEKSKGDQANRTSKKKSKKEEVVAVTT